MTSTDPTADEQERGRHATRDDAERTADPAGIARRPAHAAAEEGPERTDGEGAAVEPEVPREQPRDEPPARAQQTRSRHGIAHHPAGASLLTAAGLVTGLALAPLLFDQLRFEVATRAAGIARSAAAPWPAGGAPWFWPGWVTTLAAVVGLAVLLVAAIGVRLPDVAVLTPALVLVVTTARAAWATVDVLDAHLWELVPLCIVCVLAFGAAVTAAFRWRSPDSEDKATGAGEVAGVTVGSWLLVVLLLLGGSAIASSAETHAFGDVTSPPQDLAGLLSVRAADSPELDALQGEWVPQLGAAQIGDDDAASAYAVVHRDWATKFPAVLVRGDDIGAPGIDDTWWLSLAAQPFESADEVTAWCATKGLTSCSPVLVTG